MTRPRLVSDSWSGVQDCHDKSLQVCCWHAEVRALTCLFGLLDVRPEQQVGSLDAGLHLPQAEGVRALLPLASLGHCCAARLKADDHLLIHSFNLHSFIPSLTTEWFVHSLCDMYMVSFNVCLSQGSGLYSPDSLPV